MIGTYPLIETNLSDYASFVVKLFLRSVKHIRALIDGVSVELHQHEEVHQHPPHHGLVLGEARHLALGVTKVA